MMTAVAKLALLGGVWIATLGVGPNRWIGGLLAIGLCLAGAVILHFAAP